MSAQDSDTIIYEPVPDASVLQGSACSMTIAPGDTVLYHPMLAHGFASSLARPLRALCGHFAASECCYVSMSGHEQVAGKAAHLVAQVIN